DLRDIRRYIDWQPFFNAWEMKGSFPEILDDADSGETARKLYDDAQRMLDQLIEERWLSANGAVGLFPATSSRDDLHVHPTEARRGRAGTGGSTTAGSRARTGPAYRPGRCRTTSPRRTQGSGTT